MYYTSLTCVHLHYLEVQESWTPAVYLDDQVSPKGGSMSTSIDTELCAHRPCQQVRLYYITTITRCTYSYCNNILVHGRIHVMISKSKGRQRIRCQADKTNLHIHNTFPDIIGNKQHIDHMKSSTSLPCRNHKSCVHMT